jgi:hypothetical protein
MSVVPLAPAEWLGALGQEFTALAPGTLGLAAPVLATSLMAPPAGSSGAYLPLMAPWGSVQLALVSDEAGCGAIARGLLGMSPGEPLSAAEVADAVCEVLNILAGGVKAQLRERGPLQMGLPTFFNGPVQPTERMGVAAVEMHAGGVAGALVVVHPRT